MGFVWFMKHKGSRRPSIASESVLGYDLPCYSQRRCVEYVSFPSTSEKQVNLIMFEGPESEFHEPNFDFNGRNESFLYSVEWARSYISVYQFRNLVLVDSTKRMDLKLVGILFPFQNAHNTVCRCAHNNAHNTYYTLGGRKDKKKRTEQDLKQFKNPFFEI